MGSGHCIHLTPGARAVICNNGIANACTGEEGFSYCRKPLRQHPKALGSPEDSVLVASTGVIGMQLPIDRIAERSKLWHPAWEAARRAGRQKPSPDTQIPRRKRQR